MDIKVAFEINIQKIPFFEKIGFLKSKKNSGIGK
jgi:hypothetical protein